MLEPGVQSPVRPAPPVHISARDNPLIKALRRLAQDSAAYRKQGRVWLEGDHLCRAACQRGLQPDLAVFSESFWPLAQAEWGNIAIKNVVVGDALLRELSGLESPAPMGFVLQLPSAVPLQPSAPSLVLDQVQDPGNVGSMLRSAAAFGFAQVIALKGTAALWSPKVLRAGMGAHFGLSLLEGWSPEALASLRVPLVVTSSHEGHFLHDLLGRRQLPMPCAWAMGHEGQGVSAQLMAGSALKVRIGSRAARSRSMSQPRLPFASTPARACGRVRKAGNSPVAVRMLIWRGDSGTYAALDRSLHIGAGHTVVNWERRANTF